jgi:hypothetical protein
MRWQTYAKITIAAVGGALAVVVLDQALPNPLLSVFDIVILVLVVVAVILSLAVAMEIYLRRYGDGRPPQFS